MSYEIAINKAWDELAQLNAGQAFTVKFLADSYSIDLAQKSVVSLACNITAKDFTAILILHYLGKKIQGLPEPTGEWLTFRELANIEGYFEAFRKRAIEPVIRKYGTNPDNLFSLLERLPAKKAEGADASIVLEALPKVPLRISLWRGDEEFAPEANMFFDRSITRIFCTEDIVVLAGIVAASL